MKSFAGLLAATALSLAAASPAHADEGMWTFDHFPSAKVQADHGWGPDQAWLNHVQASAVRLTGGCSASFVSPEGLILTNHHCVIACLQQLSTPSSDLLANGFNAASRTEERACPGQQAEVVTMISDVTSRVQGAITGKSGQALIHARDAEIARIEDAGCTDRTKFRCQVVTLFGGGQYKLYTYHKYSDVRIVWAPEYDVAQFGGDPDNFNFPRFGLDGAFVRAYENGRAVASTEHLRWNPRAPVAGELTFVAGNPGSTARLLTQDQRVLQRDVTLPTTLLLLSEFRGRLISAMAGNADRTREGGEILFGVENSYKARLGQYQSLADGPFAASLAQNEADLRSRSAGNAALGDPWADVAAADTAYRNIYYEYRFLESGAGFNSDLFNYARTLVRGAQERAKPNAERLPDFTDGALPLREQQLFAAAPIYPWLEQLQLEFWLSKTREYLTADSPDVHALLGRESPEQVAARLMSGTRLADPAYRRELWTGGMRAIRASDDPLVKFVLAHDERARSVRELYQSQYEAPISAAQSRLASARFAAYGDTLYPDATFTLRLSYGTVTGWTERGRAQNYRTLIGGAFDRATGQQPYLLGRAMSANEARIDKSVTFNFTTTNDVIGGNSGSPVIARDGSVIGALFDGNIHSLGGNFGYDPALNRAIVVSTAALQEALLHIYPAPALVRELGANAPTGRRRR